MCWKELLTKNAERSTRHVGINVGVNTDAAWHFDSCPNLSSKLSSTRLLRRSRLDLKKGLSTQSEAHSRTAALAYVISARGAVKETLELGNSRALEAQKSAVLPRLQLMRYGSPASNRTLASFSNQKESTKRTRWNINYTHKIFWERDPDSLLFDYIWFLLKLSNFQLCKKSHSLIQNLTQETCCWFTCHSQIVFRPRIIFSGETPRWHGHFWSIDKKSHANGCRTMHTHEKIGTQLPK